MSSPSTQSCFLNFLSEVVLKSTTHKSHICKICLLGKLTLASSSSLINYILKLRVRKQKIGNTAFSHYFTIILLKYFAYCLKNSYVSLFFLSHIFDQILIAARIQDTDFSFLNAWFNKDRKILKVIESSFSYGFQKPIGSVHS